MKNLFICMCLTASITLSAQISTTLIENELPEDAIGYCLPQTVFEITVKTVETTETPGKYARYAERYIGISDVITTEKTHHEILSVDISAKTQPDKEKSFFIRLLPGKEPSPNKKSASAEAIPLNVFLTPSGILQSVNLTPSIKQPECQKFEGSRHEKSSDNASQEILTQTLSVYTQDMQLASSSAREAELAAKQIFSFRETRISLLQGEIDNMPQDGQAMKYYLKELNRLEQYYTELFTGSQKVETHTTSFYITPSEIPSYRVLFRFSHQKGIVDKDDLSGIPIHFLIHNKEEKSLSQPVDTVVIQEVPAGKKGSHINTPEERKEETVNLYYYYPHLTEVSILNGQQVLYRNKFVIAQFGDLMKLSSQAPIKVELNPETGGIIRREF